MFVQDARALLHGGRGRLRSLHDCKEGRDRPHLGGGVLKGLFVLVAAMGCSRNPTRPAPSSSSSTAPPSSSATQTTTREQVSVTAAGEPFGLRVEGGTISFCDRRGGRRIDLASGHDAAFERTCPKDGEANTACGGLPVDVTVSTPNLGPNDLVDADGSAFPLDGRVHDCTADAKGLAIVTGSSVVLIDTKTAKTEVIDHTGGDRVAVGPGWIAWSNGQAVHARHR